MHKKYFKFAVLASDIAYFIFDGKELLIRFIRVHRPPYFKNAWGLPGGLLRPDETARQAATRNLADKGGITSGYLEQLYTFSKIDRDPRGRVVAVAYLGLNHIDGLKMTAFSEEFRPQWFPVSKLPKLAYDHKEIVKKAIERLQAKFSYTTIAQTLLAPKFTMSELQLLYEKVLARKLDKRNFQKKLIGLKLVVPARGKLTGLAQRPAKYWRFSGKKIRNIDIL